MDTTALAERLEEMRDSLATFTDGMKAAARDGALADIAALTEAATRLRAVATVTDEDVERGWMAFTGRDKLGPGYADDAKCMTREERRDMRAALESFANKEPTDE